MVRPGGSDFTRDQAQRYDMRIEVWVEITNDRGVVERSLSLEKNLHQSVAEGITPNERDQVWYNMTKQVMSELNQGLEEKIRANMGDYFQ